MSRPSAAAPAPYPRLLGDFGGTTARLARIEASGAPPARFARFDCSAHAGIEDVLEAYLAAAGGARPRAAAIGVASTLVGDAVTMTNLPWTFSIAALQARLGVLRLELLNDFEALALGLPGVGAEALRPVGAGTAVAGAPLAVFGPGTGLGAAGLVTTGAGPLPIVGEGGHVSLSAADAGQERIVGWLRERFGHASAERALSGPGLVSLHQAICALAGEAAAPLDAATITARARAGSDARCVEALEQFFAFLGGFAGNLALSFGARGGVFIAGGIVPQLGDAIQRSAFRACFEAKGRYRSYLEAIPTWVVLDSAAVALRGADAALDR